jgi:hypothetical protein
MAAGGDMCSVAVCSVMGDWCSVVAKKVEHWTMLPGSIDTRPMSGSSSRASRLGVQNIKGHSWSSNWVHPGHDARVVCGAGGNMCLVAVCIAMLTGVLWYSRKDKHLQGIARQ